MDSTESLPAENHITLASDAPAQRDVLDYGDYRDSFLSLVKGLPYGTPLTVGIFGSWGSGKTTLLKLLDEGHRAQGDHTVWVNVWMFSNEQDVWKAFLQAIFLKVKNDLSWVKRLSFHLGLMSRRVDWTAIRRTIPNLVVRVLFVVTPLYFSLNYLKTADPGTSDSLSAGGGTLVSTILAWYLLIRPYVSAVKDRVKLDFSDFVKSAPLRSRVTRLEKVAVYYSDLVHGLIGKHGRLIVFIDDLDRCPPERLVQVLDAIKLFLEVEGCIFFLALDRAIVEEAVRLKFAKYTDPDRQVQEYLSKLITLPFELPPLTGKQMEALISDLPATLPNPELTSQVFALGQEANPRKVKRTVNIFLLVWTLAQKRQELTGKIRPTRLAKVVVIQHGYRELYRLLTISPKALGDLEAYFRTNPDVDSLQRRQDSTQQEKVGAQEEELSLPEPLLKFISNQTLRRLLTIPAHESEEASDSNFTTSDGHRFFSIPEDEIRTYIELTTSVASDDAVLKGPKYWGAGTAAPDFINRHAELDLLTRSLTAADGGRVVALLGPGGIGKTAVAQRFMEQSRARGVPAIHLDLRRAGASTVREYLDSVLQPLGRHGLPERYLILLDNFSELGLEVQRALEHDLVKPVSRGELGNALLVVCSRGEPDFLSLGETNKRVTATTLSPFSQEDLEAFFRAHDVDVPIEELRTVCEMSRGHPLAVSMLVAQLSRRERA